VTQEKIPIVGEIFTDRSKVPDSFSKIQIGLRLMPSQNDENGIVSMRRSDDDTAEDSKLRT
jgi:hypothetical protein